MSRFSLSDEGHWGCGAVVAVLAAGLMVVTLVFLFGGLPGSREGPGPNEPIDLGNDPDDGPWPGEPGAVVYRGGPGSTGSIPVISAREFTGGSAPVTVSGAFSLDVTSSFGTDGSSSSWSDGESTEISFGFNEDPDVGVVLDFSTSEGSEGVGVQVWNGDWLATSMGEGCTWEVSVTDTRVSGHISCTDVPAWNDTAGTSGTIDVDLDFSADSQSAR